MPMKWIAPLVVMTFSVPALAQQAPTPKPPPTQEETRRAMEASMSAVSTAMTPMMTKMMDTMIEQALQRGEDPETARRIARFKRNLYDALLKEGFAKDQALSIVVNTGLPMTSGWGK
jgi:hypothetical protein